MKVLISGYNGFLGNILKKNIPESTYKVLSLGRGAANSYICDIALLIPDLFGQLDIIIHAAGKAHSVPKTLQEEKEFYDVNYQGTINLCKGIDAMESKPKSFVFISTVAVYGLDSGLNISENAPLNGNTPYAKSKILAEEYLIGWAKQHNITLGILRLPLIVGPNPPGNLGTMIQGIKTGKYLSIGDASAKKSMVWAEDIANIIPKLAEVGGTYNLTDGYHPSFGELEKEISKNLGKKKSIKISMWGAKLLGKVGDIIGSKAPFNSEKLNKITSSLTFDDTKARNNLGWNPTKVLEKISQIV